MDKEDLLLGIRGEIGLPLLPLVVEVVRLRVAVEEEVLEVEVVVEVRVGDAEEVITGVTVEVVVAIVGMEVGVKGIVEVEVVVEVEVGELIDVEVNTKGVSETERRFSLSFPLLQVELASIPCKRSSSNAPISRTETSLTAGILGAGKWLKVDSLTE